MQDASQANCEEDRQRLTPAPIEPPACIPRQADSGPHRLRTQNPSMTGAAVSKYKEQLFGAAAVKSYGEEVLPRAGIAGWSRVAT